MWVAVLGSFLALVSVWAYPLGAASVWMSVEVLGTSSASESKELVSVFWLALGLVELGSVLALVSAELASVF